MSTRVVLTGARGVIGTVLTGRLTGHDVVGVDLPEHDLRRRADAGRAVAGAGQVVHLAWNLPAEDYRTGTLEPGNALMVRTVLEASLAAGVARVVLAGSVHADAYPAPAGAELRAERPPFPDSLYGADKVFGEALGRYHATLGLHVVVVRFGGVNPRDAAPVHDAAERAVWLSHRDCAALVQAVLDAPVRPGHFSCFYGVSDNPGRWHSLSNDVGWFPRDAAP